MNDAPAQSASPLSPAEEKQWATLAHLSVLLNLLTGLLGVVAPLVIYLAYRDRSRFVSFHSLQSLIFQAVSWLGGGLLAIVTGMLSGTLPMIGLVCLPLSCLLAVMPAIALVYGTIGGIQVNQGRDFRYWLIGDWVQNTILK